MCDLHDAPHQSDLANDPVLQHISALKATRAAETAAAAPASRRALLRAAGGVAVGGGLVALGAGAASAATSQNGWPAGSSSQIPLTSLRVGAATFPAGVRSGDVAVILGYVARRFNNEVEALVSGWCWGHAYRPIRNGSSLSNHSSGTAIDVNAPRHPLGASGTFSATQRARIRAILDSCNGVVRWGGNYSGRKDEMHFEINVRPGDARIAPLVRKIGGAPQPDPKPNPTLPFPTLRRGASGFRVAVLQRLLRQAGQSLSVDSSFGPTTEAKVKAFQSARRLTVDGIVGPKTWTALCPTLRKGSRGEAVHGLQTALKARGYSLTADGIFGAGTEGAVKGFQKARGLAQDGVVGPVTWSRLVA